MKVVSNSGPLIHRSWIDRLDLLPALFGEVLVPTAVQRVDPFWIDTGRVSQVVSWQGKRIRLEGWRR